MKRDIFAEINEGFDALAEQRQHMLTMCGTGFSREGVITLATPSQPEISPCLLEPVLANTQLPELE